jgi:hypothetical protein
MVCHAHEIMTDSSAAQRDSHIIQALSTFLFMELTIVRAAPTSADSVDLMEWQLVRPFSWGRLSSLLLSD